MRCKNGFTLVELLITIGIMAILIALLLPALNRARDQAKAVQCLSNERQIAMAVLMYANVSKGRLPSYGNWTTLASDRWWYALIRPYLADAGNGDLKAGVNYLRCPSAEPFSNSTYGLNYGNTVGWVFYYEGTAPSSQGSRKLSQVHPQTMMLADAGYFINPDANGAVHAIYTPLEWALDEDLDGDGLMDSNSGVNSGIYAAPFNHMVPRHGGYRAALRLGRTIRTVANMVFFDGSARPVTLREWEQNAGGIWGP